jgi:biotin-(acetyl-CoA carboxylase) ligase
MMKFEDLVNANKEIITMPIKGKEYAQVNQRIKVFRLLFPEGCISTEILKLDSDMCVMKASVFDDNGKLLGVGTAYEMKNDKSSFVNKTSYIENCETSAVGRALGMLGIGIDISIASYEEVQNAVTQQEELEKSEENQNIENSVINEVKVKALIARCEKEGVNPEYICKLCKVNKIEELTEKNFAEVHQHWQGIKEGKFKVGESK